MISLKYRHLPPDLALNLSGSNYPCLQHISMVPKMFEPLKLKCMLLKQENGPNSLGNPRDQMTRCTEFFFTVFSFASGRIFRISRFIPDGCLSKQCRSRWDGRLIRIYAFCRSFLYWNTYLRPDSRGDRVKMGLPRGMENTYTFYIGMLT